MIKGLYETHLYVENLEHSIEFYTKVLGLKQCRFGADRRTAFFWIGKDKQCNIYFYSMNDRIGVLVDLLKEHVPRPESVSPSRSLQNASNVRPIGPHFAT